MSDEYDDDEGTDAGPKDLRNALAKANKEKAELAKELASFRQERRASSVTDALKAKGVDPKLAKLYTADDVSEDAVAKWAEEFGFAAGTTQVQAPAASIDPAIAAVQRVANASYGQSGSAPAAPAGAAPQGSIEDMARAVKTLPMETLVEMGWMPKEALTQRR